MGDKVLIIQTAFIGDAILTMPMIEIIKEQQPDSIVDVLCIPASQELFRSSPSVSKVFVLHKRDKHRTLLSTIKFAQELKKNDYDKIFCPHRSSRSAIITKFINPKNSVGFNTSALSFLFKKKIRYDKKAHEVKRNIDLLGLNNNDIDWKIKPTIDFTNKVKLKIEDALKNINCNKKIVIAPGSVWKTKKYPEEYFIQTAHHFIDRGDAVLLLGSEQDVDLCKRINVACSNNLIDFSGKFSIVESSYMIAVSDLLICNDSAPTHMALFSNTPVLTLYCSTVPAFGFYPYKNNSRYLSYDDLECKPCGIHGKKSCPIKTFDCGELLSTDLVISTAEKLLK